MFVFSFNVRKLRIKRIGLVGIILVATVLASSALQTFLKIYGRDRETVFADSEVGQLLFVIDAGHGGEDSGAIGVGGVLEKDLNMALAKNIGELLEKEGYFVVYTRNEDKLLYTDEENIRGIRKISDLKNRCTIANSYPDSIFISIHMNSFGDSKYSGTQVYYSEKNDSSAVLAQAIQSKVREQIQPDNERKTKEGRGIYLLENINTDAVLVECGFLSNENECKNLSSKDYQNRLSFSIVCGIIEYVEKNRRI